MEISLPKSLFNQLQIFNYKMGKINLEKPSGNLGFYSRSYSHNRHNRLLAYNYMFPDKQIYLFTTDRLGDINKWVVPNLKIILLGNGIIGQLKLISENN